MKQTLTTGILLLFCLFSFSQQTPVTTAKDSVMKVTADTIISIRNLGSLNAPMDTANIREMVVIKVKTNKSIAVFNSLFMNGVRVKGLNKWKSSECDKTVFFRLDENVDHMALEFLGKHATDKTIVPILFSVGDSTSCPAYVADPVYLIVKEKINAIWVWSLVIILFALILLAIWFNVLKDDNNLYYSLGRTQLFFWTILFSIAYLFICYTTGELPDIPASLLIILGISIGTTATAKVIENTNKANVTINPNAKSQGFLLDILSDESSINIQRFQNVIFNLVFGLVFMQKTIANHILPSFDDNVLMLLGLSSGAYAALKVTEATKDQNAPLPPVGTDAPATPATPAAPVAPAPKNDGDTGK